MEDERIITLQLKVTRKHVLAMLAAFFLCWHPKPLGSETLTLTTYYPAPYGGYANLLTTGQTLMARDTGNVGIGTPNPLAKLHVASTSGTDAILIKPATMNSGNVSRIVFADPDGGTPQMSMEYKDDGSADLAIIGGNFGINNANPNYKLDVTGTGNISTDLTVGNDVRVGNGASSNVGDLYVNGYYKNFCRRVSYPLGATVSCSSTERAVGFLPDGNARISGFLPKSVTTSGTGTYIVVGEDWSGTMICCKLDMTP